MSHPGGRPIKFKSLEELQESIEEYFTKTPVEIQCITGLAVHLKTSRQTLMNYESKEEYFDAIKDAKDRIEFSYELRNIKRGVAGDIVALKNFGWTDKIEQEITGKNGESIKFEDAWVSKTTEWTKSVIGSRSDTDPKNIN